MHICTVALKHPCSINSSSRMIGNIDTSPESPQISFGRVFPHPSSWLIFSFCNCLEYCFSVLQLLSVHHTRNHFEYPKLTIVSEFFGRLLARAPWAWLAMNVFPALLKQRKMGSLLCQMVQLPTIGRYIILSGFSQGQVLAKVDVALCYTYMQMISAYISKCTVQVCLPVVTKVHLVPLTLLSRNVITGNAS